MYVSSEVRRREVPETSPDSTPYATAAAGASFIAILTEVSNRSTDPSAGPTPDEGTAAAEASKATEIPEREADGVDETTDTPSTTTAGEEQGTDSVESADTTATDPPAETEVVAPLPTSTAASASGTTATPGIEGAEKSPPQVDAPLEAIAESTAEGDGATELMDVSAALVESDSDPQGVAKPLTTALLDGAEAATATADSGGEGLPASPVETFPKTLNAIIAEGALRQGTEKAAETDPPPLESEDGVEAVAEPAGDQALPDFPDAPPLPQAAALESGGVRPQSTGLPRLPMANLPGELAQQIHLMQQEGARTMRLILVPENLGELQIEIHGTGDTMRVRLVSGNPAVRDALESQMGSLKDALQKQGLALDNATVDSGTTRREAAPEQERRPATPYRASAQALTTSGARVSASAPLALGSSALNILA